MMFLFIQIDLNLSPLIAYVVDHEQSIVMGLVCTTATAYLHWKVGVVSFGTYSLCLECYCFQCTSLPNVLDIQLKLYVFGIYDCLVYRTYVCRCITTLRSGCVFSFGANSHSTSIFCMWLGFPCELIWHPSSTVSQDGDTALMIASSKGHTGIVRKLLQEGATVNTANEVCK